MLSVAIVERILAADCHRAFERNCFVAKSIEKVIAVAIEHYHSSDGIGIAAPDNVVCFNAGRKDEVVEILVEGVAASKKRLVKRSRAQKILRFVERQHGRTTGR